MKGFILVAALMALSGCTSTGPVYSSLKPGRPPSGMAQVIVYETSSLRLSPIYVDMNGESACALSGFFVKDVPAGPVTLSSSIWDMPGTSRLTIDAKPGKRYYVKFQMDTGKSLGFGAFGLLGAAVAEGASSHGGPYLIEAIDEKIATEELQSLKKADCK